MPDDGGEAVSGGGGQGVVVGGNGDEDAVMVRRRVPYGCLGRVRFRRSWRCEPPWLSWRFLTFGNERLESWHHPRSRRRRGRVDEAAAGSTPTLPDCLAKSGLDFASGARLDGDEYRSTRFL
jgi:hypothetical protein